MPRSLIPLTEELSPTSLTVVAQTISPDNSGQLRWPIFFPRQNVDSVDLKEVTTLDFRPTSDRREWNSRGRLIPDITPPIRELSIVPVEGYYKWDEREMQKLGERADANSEVINQIIGRSIRRERYFELDICEEKMGSWGQQGVEVACKTWLSGGELKVNMNTWFAHFFRVGGLQFPYPDGGRKERAVARSKELWLKNTWSKQVYPLSYLIEKFKPVKDWHTGNNPVTQQVMEAGEEFYRQRGQSVVAAPAVQTKSRALCLYYTCSSHDSTLELACRNNLKQATNGHEIGCVARERTDFGDWTIVLDQPKGPLTMHQQILAGLERSRPKYLHFYVAVCKQY